MILALSSGAIAAIAVAAFVVLAVLFLATTAARRDKASAIGRLSGETASAIAAGPPSSRSRPRAEQSRARTSSGPRCSSARAARAFPSQPRRRRHRPSTSTKRQSASPAASSSTAASSTMFGLGLSGFGAACIAFLWPALQSGFGGKIQRRQAQRHHRRGSQDTKAPGVPPPRVASISSPTRRKSPRRPRAVYSGALLPGMEAGVVALYQKCVHLGCRVPWCSSAQWFECPCHGSKYNRVGEKKGGPAPRGLDRFVVSIDGGQVVVDTRAVIHGPPIGTNTTGQEAEGPALRVIHLFSTPILGREHAERLGVGSRRLPRRWLGRLPARPLAGRERTRAPGSEIELAPNRRPYFDDEALEGKRLDERARLGPRSARHRRGRTPALLAQRARSHRSGAIMGFDHRAADRGEVTVPDLADSPRARRQHRPLRLRQAAMASKAMAAVPPTCRRSPTPRRPRRHWQAPALNTVLLRFSEAEVDTASSPTAGPTRRCRPWGVEGGGAMNEQQVIDLVAYIKKHPDHDDEARAGRQGEARQARHRRTASCSSTPSAPAATPRVGPTATPRSTAAAPSGPTSRRRPPPPVPQRRGPPRRSSAGLRLREAIRQPRHRQRPHARLRRQHAHRGPDPGHRRVRAEPVVMDLASAGRPRSAHVGPAAPRPAHPDHRVPHPARQRVPASRHQRGCAVGFLLALAGLSGGWR